jgi:hypothetical protein
MEPSAAQAPSSAESYVDLGPKFSKDLTWSNDPSDLMLETYFDQDEPNLATDFNIDGLKPIIRQKGGNTFLLVDAQNRYYIWNRWDEDLFRLQDLGNGKEHVDHVVQMVMKDLPSLKKEQIWNTRYCNTA